MSAICFASAGYICPAPIQSSTVIVVDVVEVGGVICGDEKITGVIDDVFSLSGEVSEELLMTGSVDNSDEINGIVVDTGTIIGEIRCEND